MPTCAKASCEETGMLDIPYGEGRAMMGGAVYKYRCNHGVEMEGSSTLVCDGERWNGTVPHCNVLPDEPELELIVSGNAVTAVKPGDWVLVTCQAGGGHPVPDIGLTLDGLPAGSKDFRNYRNSFTFTATEEDNGKKIICTAMNKVGSSSASTELDVYTPPTNAAISGPTAIYHNGEFTFECALEGGNPTPAITWTVRDHLGQNMEMNGEKMGPGLSRMLLKTGSEEREISINCLGENNQGVVSHTMHVDTHYLPKSIEITGLTTAEPGETVHLSCLAAGGFPAPALKWRIEKSGDVEEVSYDKGYPKIEMSEDGGIIASTDIDKLIEYGAKHISIECVAEVEGLGEERSEKHGIDVIYIEKPMEIIKQQVEESSLTLEDKSEENIDSSELHNIEQIFSIEDHDTLVNDQLEETSNEVADALDYDKPKETPYEVVDAADFDQTDENSNEVISLEEKPDEKEKSKVLWIPYKPVKDIQDYQTVFESDHERPEYSHEEFLRPSDIPEAPMLKQEKVAKATVVTNPVLVSADFSSSSRISFHSVLFIISVLLSILMR